GGTGGVGDPPPALPAGPAYPALLVLRSAGGLVDTHAEAQAHRLQDFLDLVEALAPEVLRLEHLGFGLEHQLADRPDVRVLQTVVRAHRELELLDRLVEVFVARARARRVGRRLRL